MCGATCTCGKPDCLRCQSDVCPECGVRTGSLGLAEHLTLKCDDLQAEIERLRAENERLRNTIKNALKCFGDEEGETAGEMLADMCNALRARPRRGLVRDAGG